MTDLLDALLRAKQLLEEAVPEPVELYSYSMAPKTVFWKDVDGPVTRFVAHPDAWRTLATRDGWVELPTDVLGLWGLPIKDLDRDDAARRRVLVGLFDRAAARAAMSAV